MARPFAGNHHHGQPPVVLNVAEKPSVARSLQSVFGRLPGARDGGMERDPASNSQIFRHDNVSFPSIRLQGNGAAAAPAPHTMITTSVRGHLASQDFDSHTYGWSKCAPLALFDAPIETFYRSDMQPLERMIARLSRTATHVILWLDCDREGEAIADEVRTVCLQGNLQRHCIFRAKFSTVLAPEITRALHSLGRVQEAWVDAVQLRSELDLRVGAAFTRFQTLRLQRQFVELDQQQGVLSYGSCQFPTLGFVVERWARIQTFVPEDFWTIDFRLLPEATAAAEASSSQSAAPSNNNNSNSTGRPIQFTWKRCRLYDQLLATVLYETCVEPDAVGPTVTSLQGRPKNKWRPVPLATVELQKRASRYLRIGSETLMAAAEELYQQGYISYPRTETERFRPEFQHAPLLQQFASLGDACPEWATYAHTLATTDAFQMPRAGQHDDQAHPPITPCKAVDPQAIGNATQRGVYTLVVKHYLACCSRDAVGRETTLTVRLADEEFTATGLMVLQQNWLEIYQPWERWSTGQGALPPLQVGSRLAPEQCSCHLHAGRTAPPSHLSEVELISLMDRHGIGTDATIATHISTIQERAYAQKNAATQKFTPTPLGIALVQGYNSMGYQLNKPDLRREMEAECNHVAAGRKSKAQVLQPLLHKMKQTFETAQAEAEKLDAAVAQHFTRLGAQADDTAVVLQAEFSLCGACQGPMALKQQQRPQNGHAQNNNNNPRKFLHCQACRRGLTLPVRGIPHALTDPQQPGEPTKCPLCQYQVVEMRTGDGYEGRGYKLCPKCYSNPPLDHGGNNSTGNFRCFECTNAACALSNPAAGAASDPAFACPFCNPQGSNGERGQVTVRHNSRGFVLSCNRYSAQERCPYTIWLPKECQEVSVVATSNENHNSENSGVCMRCSTRHANRPVRLLRLVWKPGSLPPHFGRETITCLLCDADFRSELKIQLPQPGQVPSRPTAAGRGGGRGRGNNSAGRGRGRGRGGATQRQGQNTGAASNVTCYACNQVGHFANNCPNR